MKIQSGIAEFMRRASAIGLFGNEGGTRVRHSDDSDYGRRVEADRSWTVYHVFTGAPARIDGVTTIGLSGADATDTMLRLNRHKVAHRKERNALLCRSASFAEVGSQP